MQSHYPATFEREMGCGEADWLASLPGAVRSNRLTLGRQDARVEINGGALMLQWETLPERRIALLSIARLRVRFRFENVDDMARQHFMRYFDLYMHRGGG